MGKKILVADSDSVVQQVVSYFLKLEGYDVEAVGDGVSAMEAIEKILPDIIIMTPDLPGINGVEVSHFVMDNPQYKTTPIIFLSESEEPLLNNIPDLSQRFGIVNKPIDPTKLVNTVKEYQEKGPVPAVEIEESLKSIEELLGWDVPETRLVHKDEEVLREETREGTFDVSDMLAGVIKVSEKVTEVSAETQSAEGPSGYNHEPINPWPSGDDGNALTAEWGIQMDQGQTNEFEYEDVDADFTGGTNLGMTPGDTDFTNNAGVETAEHVEADLKSRITDEMIEHMLRKIAVDIVERAAKEIVPDIAEREIIKEIERLKGIE